MSKNPDNSPKIKHGDSYNMDNEYCPSIQVILHAITLND